MMATLSFKNVKLINTYLAMVPNAYKVYERRLVFDRIQGMTNQQLEEFLLMKIGEAETHKESLLLLHTP